MKPLKLGCGNFYLKKKRVFYLFVKTVTMSWLYKYEAQSVKKTKTNKKRLLHVLPVPLLPPPGQKQPIGVRRRVFAVLIILVYML